MIGFNQYRTYFAALLEFTLELLKLEKVKVCTLLHSPENNVILPYNTDLHTKKYKYLF